MSENSPKKGQAYLACHHLHDEGAPGWHYWKIKLQTVKRADGKKILCQWVVLCDMCNDKKVKGATLTSLVGNDGVFPKDIDLTYDTVPN